MRSAKLILTDADAGRLLDVSANSILAMKQTGANHRTALACAALLVQLEPYK